MALPADDANLENAFTSEDYSDVASDNSVYVTQQATDQYAIFEFKDKNYNNTDAIDISWNGQTDIAPSQSIVYLQVYNRVSLEWETVASNNSALADTDFSLTGVITSDLANYYDDSYWVSCRVYQKAQ